MDLLDRYLHAVKFWLPRAQQDDILAELSEDIRSQLEDREATLGVPLDEDEIAAILKQRGQPMLVANRYLPDQHLIGGCWFPLYRFVLRVVLLWVLLPIFAVIIAPIMLFTAANPGPALLDTLLTIPRAAITAFAIITLVFASLERYQVGFDGKSLEKWDPRKLPRVPAASRTKLISPFVCITELIWSVACAVAWVYFARFRSGFDFDIVRVTLAPIWQDVFWPILLILLSEIPVAWIGLLRPSWTRLRSISRLIIDGVTLTILGFLLKAGTWVNVAAPKLPASSVAEAATWTNFSIRIILIFMVLIIVGQVIGEVRQLQPGAMRSKMVA